MMAEAPQEDRGDKPYLSPVMDHNIRALLARREREAQARPFQERLASGIALFVGSMSFVYIHFVAFAAWVWCNLSGVPVLEFDPSFIKLATFTSVEAIFLSTFVLIRQNHSAEQADKRDDLNLQISLLAEHEITKLIQLTREIASKMEIAEARDPELNDLVRCTGPDQVLDTIDEASKHQE